MKKYDSDFILSESHIQLAFELKEEHGDETFLYALLIMAIFYQDINTIDKIIERVGPDNMKWDYKIDDVSETPFYHVAFSKNTEFRKQVLKYANQEQTKLYLRQKIEREKSSNTTSLYSNQPDDLLSFVNIDTAIDMRASTDNCNLLYNFFASAVGRANTFKMLLIIGEIGDQFQFNTVVDEEKGTTALDFLAQCDDIRFLQTAFQFCTIADRDLYEQKRTACLEARVAHYSEQTVGKLSKLNFHTEKASAKTVGKATDPPSTERNSGCAIM